MMTPPMNHKQVQKLKGVMAKENQVIISLTV